MRIVETSLTATQYDCNAEQLGLHDLHIKKYYNIYANQDHWYQLYK